MIEIDIEKTPPTQEELEAAKAQLNLRLVRAKRRDGLLTRLLFWAIICISCGLFWWYGDGPQWCDGGNCLSWQGAVALTIFGGGVVTLFDLRRATVLMVYGAGALITTSSFITLVPAACLMGVPFTPHQQMVAVYVCIMLPIFILVMWQILDSAHDVCASEMDIDTLQAVDSLKKSEWLLQAVRSDEAVAKYVSAVVRAGRPILKREEAAIANRLETAEFARGEDEQKARAAKAAAELKAIAHRRRLW